MKNRAKIPFFLVSRFLRRGNKWTLFLIVILVSIAFINLLFLASLFKGIADMSDNQAINTYAGNITITPSANNNFLENISDKTEKIRSINGIEGVSPQIIAPVTLSFKNIKGTWQTIAVNPDTEKDITNVSKKIYEGSYLEPGDMDQIILGREVAGGPDSSMNSSSLKGAKVGDKITVSLNGISKEFTVKGLFFTKFMFTDRFAFISQEALEQFIPDLDDKATSLNVKIKDKGEEDAIIQKIKDLGVDGQMDTWVQNASFMKSVTKTFVAISAILDAVGGLIAAVTIFIIISIDVSTKKHEIGVLRAIGIKPSLVIFTYVFQAAIYSVLGIALGLAAFTSLIMPYYTSHPFPLPIGDATLVITFGDITYKVILVFVLAVISAIIPSATATRVKILDSIKS
jgi:putative ABC transport system permease protein